jgi:hypothetical protein
MRLWLAVSEIWHISRTSKEVRQFLGTISYVRRHVPSYSSLVSPLTALASPKAAFKWGPDQQEAFHKVKEILTSEPILRYLRFDDLQNKHFIVLCDASRQGVGACLAERQPDGSEKILEYRARATNRHEKLGSATDLELGRFIEAIRWLSSLLRLAPFVVRVDHLALIYLKSLKYSTNVKLLRYAILLSGYRYKVECKKGRTHTLPYSLSRKPFSQEEKEQAKQIEPEVGLGFLSSLSDELLHELQSSPQSSLKSHARHVRRHPKIVHLLPPTLQEISDPTVPDPDNNK